MDKHTGTRMNILYDNIIFSLQRFGGISVVWSELLQRAIKDKELRLHMLDYEAQNSNRELLIPSQNQLVKMPTRWMERYREPKYPCTEPTIFHSSYFRIINHPHVKNVTTIHDLTYHFYRNGLAKYVHLWQEEKSLMHSKEIICVSESTKKDLLNLYPKLDEHRVHVVYNGVSENFKSIHCTNITPFETRGYLLYVGNRNAMYKNFAVAVDVAKIVHLPLVIVGNELTRVEEDLLRTKLGVTNYWVKRYPNQDELVTIYNHAFCLVYPSSYEGFGLPIIEAQCTGCLAIGQARSSIPEIIGNGGICVMPEQDPNKLSLSIADVVRSVLNGTIDANRLIDEGKKNSKKFSWDKTYEQIKQVYKRID